MVHNTFELEEDLIVKIELNSSEKWYLGNRGTAATYELSDTYLEYKAISDEHYATMIGELYAGTVSIPFTKVT